MSLPPIDPDLFALQRQEREATDALARTQADADHARDEAMTLRRRRASPREIAAAERRASAAADAFRVATDRLADIRRRLGDWGVPPLRDPDAPITNLPAASPVLLLPVRIETRYTADRTALRVRIFPDQLHTDTHEEPLTADERAAGQFYWQSRWDASEAEEDDVARAAFALLCQRFRARRAGWIALATRPGNLSRPRQGAPAFPQTASRDSAWTRAALAVLLPTLWTVTGYAFDSNKRLAPLFEKRIVRAADPLQVGPDPAADGEPAVDDHGVAIELPIDDGLKWTVDFQKAVDVGMGVVIADGDFAPLFAGRTLATTTIERLVVHGVCAELTTDDAAKRLEALLRAHRFTDGFGLLKPGTPTNNAADDAGYSSSEAALIAEMDPDRYALFPSGPRTALAAALGIDGDAAQLRQVDGGDFEDAATTGHMVNALWASTLGYALDQFFGGELSDAEIEQVRDFAVANLCPGGPLPTVRIGRQPYGLLPVMAMEGYVAADPVEGGIARVADKLRGRWLSGATRAPTLARSGHTLAENMQELLQQRPLAAANSFRRVLGPGAQANSNLDPGAALKQEGLRKILFDLVGVTHPVRMGALHVEPKSQRLNAPFVQAKIPDATASLSPDYLSALVSEATLTGARGRLIKHGAAPTLLEALLSAALVNEYDAAAWRELWNRRLVEDMVTPGLPRNQTLPTPEFVDVEVPRMDIRPRDGGATPIVATTSGMVAERQFDFTAGDTLIDTITKTVGGINSIVDAKAVKYLKAALDDVRALAKRPAAELDRVLRGMLDAYSHRLDAWLTALATARLRTWRARPESVGVGIGAFGWVERLRPDPRPDSDGYIHAPSIHHAQTAALLRSGHLAHQDSAGEALAIDLSSRRVRLALTLLEGVAAGQPLAALLGYRFERTLRDASPLLARYILPIRRLFPLNPPPGETTLSQSEAIAARDVVDGVKLVERRRLGGDWLAGAQPAVTANDRAAVEAVAAAIDDMFDAVKDLLVAEGVHQLVGGNLERASAALAGLDRQTRPVDPEVVRTPRHGRAFAQRAGMILVEDTPPAGWTAPPGGRAIGEPSLNAWVGRMIGDPARFRFTARVEGADGSLRSLAPVTLAELALDPLSVLFLGAPGGKGQPSELQERIAARFAAQLDTTERETGALRLLGGGEGGQPGLSVLEALLDRLRVVAGKHRAMTANDLATPGAEAPHWLRPDLVAARADAVEAELSAAVDEINESLLGGLDAHGLTAALERLSRAGMAGATPVAGAATELEAQLGEVIGRARRQLGQAAQIAQALVPDASEQTTAAAQVARLRALLGPGFPVLVPFDVDGGGPVFASLASGPALTGEAPAVLHGWLTQMAAVKPHLAELADALTASELAGGGVPDLAVAQLPHAAAARWIGLPLTPATPEEVELSLVVHAPGLDPANPPPTLAGLVSDSWTEVIPGRTETTAIAFNYDAPGARPPQTMLLAVHPDPSATAWRPSQLLATVNAAVDLAHIRAVRPQDLDLLGDTLPLLYLPENFDTDRPGLNFNAIATAARANVPDYLRNVLGKG